KRQSVCARMHLPKLPSLHARGRLNHRQQIANRRRFCTNTLRKITVNRLVFTDHNGIAVNLRLRRARTNAIRCRIMLFEATVMMSLTAEAHQRIAALVASRQDGFSLPGDFYSDELVYRGELERIWRSGWLFVGHTCEIPNAGDYFTFAVGDDSLIVI